MTELLDLEELDRNLYRGLNEDRPAEHNLFGGQVAAQCLMAAGRTVPEGRAAHSLHGYFLRPGRPNLPVILQVHRDRDGRSFSARRVEALQRGEVIFSMSASFQEPRDGAEYLPEPPVDLPDPETAPVMDEPWLNRRMLELRPFDSLTTWANSRLWARLSAPLADDPLVHACALTYLSDFGTGFANVEVEGLPKGGPSLDHAMWFHAPIRADGWVLIDLAPRKAGGMRGLYDGAMYDEGGTLGALLAQEVLLRPWSPEQIERMEQARAATRAATGGDVAGG